ncbi:hypothetical protein A2U01_0097772, partial [Trifolium medium]|nr:hypothetical protein [Trifolium medium]
MVFGTVAATPKRKRADKEKIKKDVEGKKKKSEVRASGVASVSDKEKITKKPRTQKKRV